MDCLGVLVDADVSSCIASTLLNAVSSIRFVRFGTRIALAFGLPGLGGFGGLAGDSRGSRGAPERVFMAMATTRVACSGYWKY